jgi:hypothetical protein
MALECKKIDCGCSANIGAECVRYNGPDLANIPLKKGDNIELVLKNLNDRLSGLSITPSPLYVEEFVGNINSELTLSQDATDVLLVFYNGVALPNVAYVFNSPNKVVLNLSAVSLTLSSSDVVKVQYK